MGKGCSSTTVIGEAIQVRIPGSMRVLVALFCDDIHVSVVYVLLGQRKVTMFPVPVTLELRCLQPYLRLVSF